MQTETIKGFQLSPQQKRLWQLQQRSSAYLTQSSFLLEGDIQPKILKAVLQQIINRHEIIRTSFHCLPEKKLPVMVVEDSICPLWQDIDLSNWNEQQQLVKIEEIFQQERFQYFDLDRDVLLRFYFLKLSASKHLLMICLPALCADTCTIKNLLKEVSVFYSEFLKDGELCHSETMQYLQVSEWQNQLLEDEEAETANEYWCQQKLSSSDRLKLPFENQPLEPSGFNPECIREAIAPELTAKISTLAQKYDTSSQVVLLACWQTLIWRLTGEQDIIIGQKSERREYEELQDVLGPLATWLPIKSHLSPDLRFFEVLELDQAAITDAQEWQDYFVPEPVGNGKTLAFPVGFEFEQLPKKHFAPDVSFSLYQQYSCIEPFKVKLTCTQHNDFLDLEFYYDVNYFSVEAIQRLARHFHTLLVSATEDPDAAISQLEILNQSDRQQLLFEFNQVQVDYPLDRCIHHLFEEQVEKTPNNIAVLFEDQQLTYAELNASANQLAHYLQGLGVEPEVLVGIYLERSLEMIIALLGILKAGGAYLPLDPALPTSSLEFRLQDAQTKVLLTQGQLVKKLPEHTAQLVCMESAWEAIAREDSEDFRSEVRSENLVYTIYTSGSIGKPKGVAIEHQQLVNYLYSIQDILNLPARSSFAHVSTLAADLGNTVIFPSLCSGGCLHIVSSERVANATALADYFQRYPIDCLKIVPSHLAALLASSPYQSILPRQLLILGGEVASWQLIEPIQKQVPECQILNHYGPTEATIGTLTYPVKNRQTSDGAQTVPLGRPLANVQVYVLDKELQPLPLGVQGELYISGAGLARGYLNRPEQTAEWFIANPFLSESGTRLYKTGDLVRYLPDGNLEFIGRVDHQVKIRGFRVEPGEIESVLNQHSGVQQAVVSVQEDELNGKRLATYVVPSREQAPRVSDLRNFLRERLPEYMIPSAFILLKALPLTANGKLDRHALPFPDSPLPELEVTYVPPRTEVEQTIAGIWQEMLHLEKVGINDNFFDLGGHSLLLIQVHSKLQKTFKREILVTDLFEYPTISSLTKYLSKEASETSSFETSSKRAENRITSRQSRMRTR